MSKKKVLGALVVGLAVGIGVGMLFFPKKGSETRKNIKNNVNKIISKTKKEL